MNAFLNTSAPLTPHDVDALMQGMGQQARAAATVMAAASTAEKNAALTVLARLIREQGEALQTANLKDIAAAEAAGLAAPMVDRLRINAKIVEQMAQNAEQVAALPDPVGEEIGRAHV